MQPQTLLGAFAPSELGGRLNSIFNNLGYDHRGAQVAVEALVR
ncbi:MAG TPA: hypothetical protein VFQ31_05560 [Methyloceanibacter sp.]|nr:hypothetical protein [Methyloceanibacter sp.]